MDITNLLIQLVITVVTWLIFVSPALWISGRLLAGKQNAKFTDALWIAAIGAVVFYLFNAFVTECDPEIRPMDEVMVVDQKDDLVALGRAILTRDEMFSFRTGIAVKVREGIKL
jgi:hypothetical protein